MNMFEGGMAEILELQMYIVSHVNGITIQNTIQYNKVQT